MIQEGHIITLPAPVCGAERWAVLRLATHDHRDRVSLWYATLACELEGERRVVDLREDACWLTRERRGEVLSRLHPSEHHDLHTALEVLLREQGLDVRTRPPSSWRPMPPPFKPSAAGLAPWEVLERLDAWALGVDGLRVSSTIWGELQRQLKVGDHRATVGYQGQRWRVWDHGQPTLEVLPEQLLDRVIELVRSMRAR